MTETTSVFIRVGSDTAQKWERICAGYSTQTAAFTALVENYYWRHQMGPEEDDDEQERNFIQLVNAREAKEIKK